MASAKTRVIEYLFHKHWDAKAGKLRKTVITMSEVQEAINHCNQKYGSHLSTANPANFMKDIVRGLGASKNWPEELKQLRYTAHQRPGDGNVFEFKQYGPDQTEPFPNQFFSTEQTPKFKLQSLSMPIAAKKLGRSDEPWLIQTAVNLRLIETHFSIVSKLPVAQINHLQMSVKLRETEIDALFLATCIEDGKLYDVIITCEAKQRRERILDHQIINQVKAAFGETDVGLVVPVAIQAIKNVGFYVVEFVPTKRAEAKTLDALTLASDAIYELVPPVEGI